MRLLLASLLGAFLILGSILLCRFGPRAVPSIPVVSAEPRAYNFGHVLPGSYVQTSFLLKNEGSVELEFGKVTASCGCTTPSLAVRSLRPGASTKLNVGFRVTPTPGAVTASVFIETNDPSRPVLTLALFADSWAGAVPEPQSVNFGRVRPGASLGTFIQIRAKDGIPFRITDMMSDMGGRGSRV
ncbi:MAG: DUF1573 domain-containing protein [Isosphaeraceae bacterium]